LDILLENKLGQGRHYNNLGLVYQNKGELNTSIEHFEKSLAIFTEANNQNGISIALSGLGIVYSIKGDYVKSIDYNLDALRIFETLNNINLVLNTLNNLGIAYQYSGNIPKALDCFNKSIRLHNQYEIPLNGSEHGNIGLIYTEYGSYELALQMQLKVLEICEKNNDVINIALCLGNMGNLYAKLSDYEKSREYHTKSKEKSASIGLKTAEANAMVSLGNILSTQKKYDDALKYYYKAHQHFDSMGAIIYIANNCSNICKVYTHQKKYGQAIEQGQKAVNYALQIGNPDAIKGASRNLYHAYRLNGEVDKAIINLALLRFTISNDLENNYLSFSEGERENYFASIEDDLSNYFDFAVEYHKIYPTIADTVYNLALSNKGLSLKSSTFIRNTILNSSDTSLIKDYNDFLELKKQISENFSNGVVDEELKTKTNDLEKKLISQSGAYSDFNKVKNLDWKQVQAGLNSNEAAIEFINYKSYIDTSNQLYYAALIIKKDSKHPQIVKLCTEEELKEVIGKFSGTNLNYVNKIYGTKSKGSAKGLYQKIWKPLELELKGIKNIYYSPSGLLHKISFAAISISENSFLCDTYNLNQRSSTGKLASPTNVLYDQSDNFLIIGGVQYNSESVKTEADNYEVWKYLPGTAQESQRINSFLTTKKNSTTLLSANEASEANFKDLVNKATILHVSTHGFFYPDPKDVREEMNSSGEEIIDEIAFRGTMKLDSAQRSSTNYANWNFVLNKNPLMRSGIVLSGANEVWQRNDSLTTEDGILTSQEVSNLNLTNCNLVVLSACETGLGDIKGSEGVFGLQRAFKMAGVEFLIMSLWQVPDKETAEFMELFYKNLTKLKDISIAFNTTQKSMRKKYDPFYWAAFTLIN
jgi:CHAT domain-containing protein